MKAAGWTGGTKKPAKPTSTGAGMLGQPESEEPPPFDPFLLSQNRMVVSTTHRRQPGHLRVHRQGRPKEDHLQDPRRYLPVTLKTKRGRLKDLPFPPSWQLAHPTRPLLNADRLMLPEPLSGPPPASLACDLTHVNGVFMPIPSFACLGIKSSDCVANAVRSGQSSVLSATVTELSAVSRQYHPAGCSR